MVMTITDVLNVWNEIGVFSYLIPFLLLFAVVFAILEKTKVLGENKAVMSIVAMSTGLLSLQFDYVSEFFAIIFPRFGIGLSVFLVLIILIGFFYDWEDKKDMSLKWVGYLIGIAVAIWALTSWDDWRGSYGFGGWLSEYFWALIILGLFIWVVVAVSGSGSGKDHKKRRPESS